MDTLSPDSAPTTPPTPRPWYRPPARNYRPHPGHLSSIPHSPSPPPSSPPPSLPSECLPHYYYRAFCYILRIPFRELIGNVARPYDPAAPSPLADIPLHSVSLPGTSPSASAPIRHPYLPQIRKAWATRTSDMSWALSTAFFSTVLATVAVISALALNWQANCVYLKVYLVLFVIRKWIVSAIIIDRALYRLPLGLVERDPDIDEERHNGLAIYMSQLFTWHGYAMFLGGSLYVFSHGISHWLGPAPAITGVAIAFACLGLVPFLTLLGLMLLSLVLLYLVYMTFVCMVWPLEKCGLSRRRAVSRRNGGYRSSGTTNTTDLREVARDIENAEQGFSGFGNSDHLKITPAMAAIPIIIFRKPGKENMAGTSEKTALHQGSETLEKKDSEQKESLKQENDPEDQSNSTADQQDPGATSALPSTVSTPNPLAPSESVPTVVSTPVSSTHITTSSTDALDKMPNSLSTLRQSAILEISASTAPWAMQGHSQTSSTTSFIPCVSGQDTAELEGRNLPHRTTANRVSGKKSSSPAAGGRRASNPIFLSTNPSSSGSSKSQEQLTGLNRRSFQGLHTHLLSDPQRTDGHALVPRSPARMEDVLSNNSNNSGDNNGGHGDNSNSAGGSGQDHSTSVGSLNSHPSNTAHSIVPMSEWTNFALMGDQECAVCLFDFEDGDELRHLYCDHLFHRNCVDRWLVKNPFCPKCKRGI